MYDLSLFIEIIESQPGILFLRLQYYDGVHARVYQGLHGNPVIIDTTEEDIDIETAQAHLVSLGLAELVPLIFPAQLSTGASREVPDDEKAD